MKRYLCLMSLRVEDEAISKTQRDCHADKKRLAMTGEDKRLPLKMQGELSANAD